VLVAAMVIDSVGSGLTAPFILVVGHVLVGLSLPVTGLAAAIGAGVGIAGGPVAGIAVDRFGPARVVVAANMICAIGNTGLLLAHGAFSFGVASAVCAFAVRAFYSAFTPLISSAALPEHREKWFGWLRAARHVGLTLGGVLASLAMLAGQRTGLRVILGGDALTYVVAGSLVLVAVGSTRPLVTRSDLSTSPAGYGTVLADRGNLVLAGLNVLCTVLTTAPLLAIPVYVLEHFPRAIWLPGALSAAVSTAFALVIIVVPGATRGTDRLRVLAVAASLWAASSIAFAVAGLPSGVTAVTTLFLAATLLGMAGAVYAPTADALPLFLAPSGFAGRYTAVHQFAWGVASVVSPLLASFLPAIGPYAVWIVLAGLAAVTAVVYQALRPWLSERAGRAGTTERADSPPRHGRGPARADEVTPPRNESAALHQQAVDRRWMRAAVELSRNSPIVASAYAVGAIVVDGAGRQLSTGYSRETDTQVHAEESALAKLAAVDIDLSTATMYTSLEPCSARKSRATTCTQLIIDAGIPRVVFALYEPPLFADCHGVGLLRAAGVEVVQIRDLADEVRAVNASLLAQRSLS
jgi:diaminohydroxyphosphoribosylaminopyrimidine deaminase/5-amino-6-(5-phosphoribosylamino)uracil reductase